jgi:hypothetical protein
MVGGVGGVSVLTVIVKAWSEAVRAPSSTVMTMPESEPTSAAAGVPLSWPVVVLKVAHAGLLVMAKVNPLPEVSETLG